MSQASEELARQRFSGPALRTIGIARMEARAFEHNYIGSEHLLLGLLAEESVSAHALRSLGVELADVRHKIERIVGRGEPGSDDTAPLSPGAVRILDGSLREARSLGDDYVGTQHLLLSLSRETKGVAGRILLDLGVNGEALREAAFESLRGPAGDAEREQGAIASAGYWDMDEPYEEEPYEEEEEQQEEETNGELGGAQDEEAIEAVPTHRDRPATYDELGRERLAEVLGERIRRVRGEDTEAAIEGRRERRAKLHHDNDAARRIGCFMTHIHAPWGAGKSSLLNFLAVDLRNRRRERERLEREHSPDDEDRRGRWERLVDFLLHPRRPANPNLSQWIVVEFSAWEHQRLVAPWWWLLRSVQRSCAQELWQINRGRWLWFWIRDIAWRLWNARAALITLALFGSLIAVSWLLDWFGLLDQSLTGVRALLLTGAALITVAGTIVGLVRGTSKWLAIGSAEGAVRFLKRAHDPLGVYRRRFKWLVRASGRPITVFIDDLDRCRPEYVVELLEGIQTLFAAEPVTYVVAADRAWLCESFARSYSEFESSVGELGRPLGFLFLEKTFQISLEIPPMSEDDRDRYWARLLSGARNGSRPNQSDSDEEMETLFAEASTQAEIEQGVEEHLRRRDVDGDKMLQAAVRRLNSPKLEEQLKKLLSEFTPLLENNPRSMKRLINAYGIERDRLLRASYFLDRAERRELALLTILRLRWPLFADHLRRHPEDTKLFRKSQASTANHPYGPLFENPEVRRLFEGKDVPERLEQELLERFPRRPPFGAPAQPTGAGKSVLAKSSPT